MKKAKLLALLSVLSIAGVVFIYNQKPIFSGSSTSEKTLTSTEENKIDNSIPLTAMPASNHRSPASAEPTPEPKKPPGRLPEAPKEWSKLPDETVQYAKKYGDQILDIHTEFVGHPTPWKRSVLLSSKSQSNSLSIQIEEHLDSDGNVTARIPMVSNHLLVTLKQNHNIEEALKRVPNTAVTQTLESTNTHLVEFQAQDAKKLNEMVQSFLGQTDLVESAIPNIVHDMI